ncbi:MAG TPA: glutathione-independent formaldehyde dehydrogenase [Polyangia bacterium]|jgi:glutathione-independent formaldehyde dehydrogenase|nr:glutathione-independent formaldehyde dehydrogenase [Polyangia bacterium]
MRAIVYKEPNKVVVEQVPDPRIENPTDAIVRVTSAGICGSDLHMYEGRSPAGGDMRFGHENMGVVEEVGDAVLGIKKGDRVVMPFNVSCGTCFNCTRGYTQACLVMNPEGASAGYGYAAMGPYPGGQAEYLRVPRADFNCLKLPGRPGDELEDDFLLLSDVFPTGYHATELAAVGPGDTVAVFGAGPVGLLAAYSSILRGAAEVYVVDSVEARLEKAREIGCIPIDFRYGEPCEQVKNIRGGNALLRGALRPGEEKMLGVMCGIDAVGYQARRNDNPGSESPVQVLEELVHVVNPTGRLGIVGVYFPQDPGGVDEHAKSGRYELPFGQIWDKGLSLGMGQCPVKRYNAHLRDLIIAGRARPSFIVSHRLSLDEAPLAYEKFDRREDGYTKVILKPGAGKVS